MFAIKNHPAEDGVDEAQAISRNQSLQQALDLGLQIGDMDECTRRFKERPCRSGNHLYFTDEDAEKCCNGWIRVWRKRVVYDPHKNIEVEYMVKDNEGHGFSNQENRFEFYTAMEKFMETHLLKNN